jgi:hypothetical protein
VALQGAGEGGFSHRPLAAGGAATFKMASRYSYCALRLNKFAISASNSLLSCLSTSESFVEAETCNQFNKKHKRFYE